MKLSHLFSGSLKQFLYWIANGTVGYPLLKGIGDNRPYCDPAYTATPGFDGSNESELY